MFGRKRKSATIKTKRVTINFKDERLYEKLKYCSFNEKISMSSFIESIVEEYLAFIPSNAIMNELIKQCFLVGEGKVKEGKDKEEKDKEGKDTKFTKIIHRTAQVQIYASSIIPEYIQKKIKEKIFDYCELYRIQEAFGNVLIHFYTIIIRNMNIKKHSNAKKTYYDVDVNYTIIPIVEPIPMPEVLEMLDLEYINFSSLAYKTEFEFSPEKNAENEYSPWFCLPFTFCNNGTYVIKLRRKKKAFNTYSNKDPNFYSVIKPANATESWEKAPKSFLVNYIGIPYIPFLLSKYEKNIPKPKSDKKD